MSKPAPAQIAVKEGWCHPTTVEITGMDKAGIPEEVAGYSDGYLIKVEMTFANTIAARESVGVCFMAHKTWTGLTSGGDAMCVGAWAGDDDGSFADGGAFGMPRDEIVDTASFWKNLFPAVTDAVDAGASNIASDEFVTLGGAKVKTYDTKTDEWVTPQVDDDTRDFSMLSKDKFDPFFKQYLDWNAWMGADWVIYNNKQNINKGWRISKDEHLAKMTPAVEKGATEILMEGKKFSMEWFQPKEGSATTFPRFSATELVDSMAPQPTAPVGAYKGKNCSNRVKLSGATTLAVASAAALALTLY